MTTLKWLASAILGSVMIPALYSEAHCPRDVVSIRPRFIEHSILVLPVTLNHSGPFDFVLDTAAQVTTIDPELAAELHLKLLGQTGVTGAGFSTHASYTLLDSLQASAYEVKDLLLLIHNLGQVQIADPRVRGILGENFLEHFDLLIDYAHGIVCLDTTKQMQQNVKGEHIALVGPSHLDRNMPFTEPPSISVRVSGLVQPLLLELDSGINSPLLFVAGKLRPAAFSSATLHSRGTDGASHAYTVLPPQDIQVGLHSLQQISFVTPVAGNQDIPDAEIDGVLPTALFARAFISYADRFAVLEPR
ncbi:retropepsin-like aspartic protease [Alloacidobacterium sp.]|uniref:retropepsin-like aspartic protease n=1 Tax=Alloacidobacterium sp. TaxID=2951999 RepID=UPI002D722FC5|nr:retropepsin-like aspartic protease [Alloacidobacterium sp.]HYK34381.1 retropepsin-like aspartic protease [Alloacidobacterium sp.]